MSRRLLFEWQDHVTGLGFRGEYPFDGPHATRLLAFAVALSDAGKGTTGDGITLAPVAERLAIPVRTLRRYVAVLTEAGLLKMTERPARAQLGSTRGRRARYGLAIPSSSHNVCHDDAEAWHTSTTGEVAHVVRGADDEDAPSLSTTCAKAEREPSAVLRSHPGARSGDVG